MGHLGHGSVGEVYDVTALGSGREAALKVLRAELLDDRDLRARFEREVIVTTAIDHPHVVATLDAGIEPQDDAPYYVMERLAGLDLEQRLARLGPPPPDEVVLLLGQVAAALDHTHDRGIVHRDINPKNLFVTADAQGQLCVKVLDFGVAKVIAQSPHAKETLAAGTPYYMSPEQVRGAGDVGVATDVYALAMVAYALLTGRPYFADEYEATRKTLPLIRAIATGPAEPASHRAARHGFTLPASFDPWFAEATRPAPSDRPDAASALVATLAPALGVTPWTPKTPRPSGPPDPSAVEGLVLAAIDGDDAAWRRLAASLWPVFLERVRRHRAMGSLREREDHVGDVVMALIDKLSPDGGGALGAYPDWRARHPGKAFDDWLRIVTAFTVRDHVRKTLGRGQRDPSLPSAKLILNEFAMAAKPDDHGSIRPAYTRAQLAQALLRVAREQLDALQLGALTEWIQGADFAEIAEAIGTDEETARKRLRSAVAVLRRRFSLRDD